MARKPAPPNPKEIRKLIAELTKAADRVEAVADKLQGTIPDSSEFSALEHLEWIKGMDYDWTSEPGCIDMIADFVQFMLVRDLEDGQKFIDSLVKHDRDWHSGEYSDYPTIDRAYAPKFEAAIKQFGTLYLDLVKQYRQECNAIDTGQNDESS